MAGLAAAAFCLSFVVYRALFPLYSGDLDEGVYVFQAHMLLHGLISLPAARYGQFFRPWLSGQRDGRIFTEFQFGLPLLLASFLAVFHSIRVGLALVAAVTVVAMHGFTLELLGRRAVALGASVFLALSPIFVIQSGLVLTYQVTLMAFLLAGWALLRGARTGRLLPLALGGIALGLAVLTRPPDALCFGLPLVALTVHRVAADRELRAAITRVVVPVLAGVAPFVGLTFWYNWQATGSPLSFPNMAADPLNTFGFGTRQLMIGQPTIVYTVGDAARALERNIGGSPGWVFGGGVTCALALIGVAVLWRSGRRAELATLLVIFGAFPALYFFWWATVLSDVAVTNGLGPTYYVPSFVPLIILAVVGVGALASRFAAHRRTATVVLAAVLAGVTGWAVPGKVSANLLVTHEFQRTDRLVSGLEDALVFLHPSRYLLQPYPFLQTSPGLSGPVVYATDRGAADARLMAELPRRHAYILRSQYEPGNALFHPSGGLVAESGLSAPELELRLVPHLGQSSMPVQAHERAYISVGGATHYTRLRRRGSGFAPVVWRLSTSPSSPPGAISLHARSHGLVTVGIEGAESVSFTRPSRDETRLAYSVASGSVTIVAPGLGWKLVQFPKGGVWLPSDVTSAVALTVKAVASR